MELHRLTNFTDERIAFCKSFFAHDLLLQINHDKINRQSINDFLDGLETWKEIKKTINTIKDCPPEEKTKLALHLRELAHPMLDKIMDRLKKLDGGADAMLEEVADDRSEEVVEMLKKHSIKLASDIEEIGLIYQELESILPATKP